MYRRFKGHLLVLVVLCGGTSVAAEAAGKDPTKPAPLLFSRTMQCVP